MLGAAFSAFAISTTAQNFNIIPKPQEVKEGKGSFTIKSGLAISSDDAFCAEYLAEKIKSAAGVDVVTGGAGIATASNNCISIKVDKSAEIPQEGYKLLVTPERVEILASTGTGAFYGVQTLMQLMPSAIYGGATGFECWKIPAVEINDYPRFSYRGLMLDVSRTFFGLETLYKFADWLAYHKVNKFHLHIVDDNGWRIEIKKYPVLTQKGAWRGPGEVLPPTFGSGNKRYGGFYTQKEMKDFIKYCKERHIEVIPEIDLPGHSKAIAACMPEILCQKDKDFESVQGEIGNVFCVGREENYKILDNIIKEIASIFESDYIHIGGDEVAMENWLHCNRCKELMEREGMTSADQIQNNFVKRMSQIVEKHGKKMAGWDEIIDGGELDKNTRVYAWKNMKRAHASVSKGYPTIIQVGEYNYVDMKQSPLERGHNWAGIVPIEKTYSLDPCAGNSQYQFTESQAALVIGSQVGLWTELLNRPARFVEYQIFPRLAASAEVGWTNQNLREWNDFHKRLTESHYDRMYNMGIAFRIPWPEVIYEDNTLKVKKPFKSAVIRYTTDGSEPTVNSATYNGDIVTDKPQEFRFATFYNQFKSITVCASNVERYKYLTPDVEIESSLEAMNQRWSIDNIKDYDSKTYFRSNRKAQAGDYVTYKFKEAVKCSMIIVETGIPNIDFYGVTDGILEYSYNGVDFIKGAEFADNVATLHPDKPIKAVRISVTAPNDAHTLCLQDIKVVE